jgi:predicted  nucleic acid-binding Zn-ribbon protein
MPKVVIPCLKRLRVDNYELYPPHPELGELEHEFVPGVNVILGINGLGKTTLLNMIFRLLVGPYDPSKGDRIRPGRKQASLKHANIDFFRKRVRDDAVDATATAVFAFGDAEVEITRNLDDLSLVSYRFGDECHEAGVPARDLDDVLMELVCRLAGLDTTSDPKDLEEAPENPAARELPAYRYDFDFLIRNLVFFLEDKVPLIWNPEGQFVVLRILLVGEALSKAIAEARNELLRIDSLYRNRVWTRNSVADTIKKTLDRLRKEGVAVEQRDLLMSELGGVEARREDLEGALTRLQRDIEGVDTELLRTRAELFDGEMVLREEEAVFFHSAFATAKPPADLIVQALASRQGCLVCGNRSEDTHRLARARLDRHCCPVCDSQVAEHEGAVSYSETRKGKLAEAEDRVATLQRRYGRLGKAVENARLDYDTTLDELSATRKRHRELRLALASAEGLAQVREEVEGLQAQLTFLEADVIQLEVDLEVAQREHEVLIRNARNDVERFSDAIVAAFNGYAKDFMVDDCRLRYIDNRRGKVAQADRLIDWPAFEVEMSSGQGNGATKRMGHEEVSESQKEFVDLAFRMALLKAASDATPAMLAVETPEASLDAVFMSRAGRLLREFGSANPGNILVVSCNLTGESMIPRLLGVGLEGGEDLDARMRRVINLLRLARPTKALLSNGEEYEAAFRKAVGIPDAAPASGPDDAREAMA